MGTITQRVFHVFVVGKNSYEFKWKKNKLRQDILYINDQEFGLVRKVLVGEKTSFETLFSHEPSSVGKNFKTKKKAKEQLEYAAMVCLLLETINKHDTTAHYSFKRVKKEAKPPVLTGHLFGNDK